MQSGNCIVPCSSRWRRLWLQPPAQPGLAWTPGGYCGGGCPGGTVLALDGWAAWGDLGNA